MSLNLNVREKLERKVTAKQCGSMWMTMPRKTENETVMMINWMVKEFKKQIQHWFQTYLSYSRKCQ